jgi:hypothetical protein
MVMEFFLKNYFKNTTQSVLSLRLWDIQKTIRWKVHSDIWSFTFYIMEPHSRLHEDHLSHVVDYRFSGFVKGGENGKEWKWF